MIFQPPVFVGPFPIPGASVFHTSPGLLPIAMRMSQLRVFTTLGNGSPYADVQLLKNGAGVDAVVRGSSTVIGVSDIDVLIPAVTAANVDGDARVGVSIAVSDPTVYTRYTLIGHGEAAADYNASVFALGSVAADRPLYNGGGSPRFGWPPALPFSLNTLWSPAEDARDLVGTIFESGDARIPWSVPGTLYAFKAVDLSGGGFPGVTTFAVRVNGATALSVTTANDGTRVYSDNSEYQVNPGDLVCFMGEGVNVSNATLLVAFRPQDLDGEAWGIFTPWGRTGHTWGG